MNTVSAAGDLVTSTAATIAGFAWQAQQKAAIGVQYQQIANNFSQNAAGIANVAQIVANPQLLDFAIGACSLSRKSLNHLGNAAVMQMINALINIGQLNNPAYVRDLEQRYLLTCGDSVGGSMRNIIGRVAQDQLSNVILNRLNALQLNPAVDTNNSNKILKIDWIGPQGTRRLVFDKKSPIIVDPEFETVV